MIRVRRAVVVAVAIGALLATSGCGKKDGGLFSEREDAATATTTTTTTTSRTPAPSPTTTAPAPGGKPVPEAPSAGQLISGKAACDLGPPVSVEFPELPEGYAYEDVLPTQDAATTFPADALPVKPVDRDGEPAGRVGAASFEQTPQGARIRARYLRFVRGLLAQTGVTTRRSGVAGRRALTYRTDTASVIVVTGSCRVWTISAPTGKTARTLGNAIVRGEAG